MLRYYDHEFPVAVGTESLALPELVDAQNYVLTHWRDGGSDLNYRRFFDVTTLIAVRVEDPDVFYATHHLLLDLHQKGAIDGFRIDHPDGLADPEGYFARLADASGDAWVVAEKILEGEEQLPEPWRCAGTTGYDTLLRIQQALTSGGGVEVLDRLWSEHAPGRESLDDVVLESKQLVVESVQGAEVNRLLRLAHQIHPGLHPDLLREALEALLVAMDRYRAYVVPGRPVDAESLAVLDAAGERARAELRPAAHDNLDRLLALARDEVPAGAERALVDDFVVRFQQTCGPVMAKGIEDTAFYRWSRMTGANEVGGHPAHLSINADEFHAFAEQQQATWPTTMTTLTTHDTKRSEDVRARLMTIAESADDWSTWVQAASDLAAAQRGLASRACDGVPHLADRPRHLAHHAGPHRGLRPQGDPRGQGPHRVGRRRRRLRGGCRGLRALRRLGPCRRRARRRPGCRSTQHRCGPTSWPRNSSSWSPSVCPTSTRELSCRRSPSWTPTTAGRSTTPTGWLVWPDSTQGSGRATSTTRSCS